jgi:hypothetical protein
VLDADGKPVAPQPPQPRIDGTLGVPREMRPIEWTVEAVIASYEDANSSGKKSDDDDDDDEDKEKSSERRDYEASAAGRGLPTGPKDVATVVKKRVSKIKKKAVTEKQYERFDEVQKELKRDLKNWEISLVKDKKEVGTAIDELNFIERNGGLTESQGLEYVKLMKLIGAPTVSDLDKIKRGMKASQILK